MRRACATDTVVADRRAPGRRGSRRGREDRRRDALPVDVHGGLDASRTASAAQGIEASPEAAPCSGRAVPGPEEDVGEASEDEPQAARARRAPRPARARWGLRRRRRARPARRGRRSPRMRSMADHGQRGGRRAGQAGAVAHAHDVAADVAREEVVEERRHQVGRGEARASARRSPAPRAAGASARWRGRASARSRPRRRPGAARRRSHPLFAGARRGRWSRRDRRAGRG